MIEKDADLKNLPSFIELAHKYALELGFEASALMHIELALEEVIVNIINYAYPNDSGKIELTCTKEKESLLMKITDYGIPFDILAATDPDVSVPLEDRKIGGLGVFFVKKLMDEVRYERRDAANILYLIKKKK